MLESECSEKARRLLSCSSDETKVEKQKEKEAESGKKKKKEAESRKEVEIILAGKDLHSENLSIQNRSESALIMKVMARVSLLCAEY